MTKQAAHTVANLILASAGLAAAYVVITTPPLRRVVFGAARWWIGGSVPVFLLSEAGKAWAQSATLNGSRYTQPDVAQPF